MYNLHHAKVVLAASLRHQCARRNFYGADLEIERAIQPFEGEYARAVSEIKATGALTGRNADALRTFTALQFTRTETAMKRVFASQDDMAALIFDDDEERKAYGSFSEADALRMSIEHSSLIDEMMRDLSVRIFQNRTDLNFVTSDDPVVPCNRFIAQKMKRIMGGAGLTSAGLTIYLPLTPRLLAVFFDRDIYAPAGLPSQMVAVKSRRDVQAANCMQYIKCSGNLFFSSREQVQEVENVVRLGAPFRPKRWHSLNYAILDSESEVEGHKTYKVVDRASAGEHQEALVHLHSEPLVPPFWFSGLPYRPSPKYVDTGTGRGLVRRATAHI